MRQQRERGTVGPVQILEHEQHRRRRRQHDEQIVDRLEHEIALRIGLRLHRFGQVGEVGGDIGNQTRQQRSGPHDLRADLGGGRGAQVPAHRFDERLVGHHVLLIAPTRQHRRVLVVQHAGELDHQARLAHARVAADERDASTVGRHRLSPPRSERRQLGLTADEGRIGDERGRERDA